MSLEFLEGLRELAKNMGFPTYQLPKLELLLRILWYRWQSFPVKQLGFEPADEQLGSVDRWIVNNNGVIWEVKCLESAPIDGNATMTKSVSEAWNDIAVRRDLSRTVTEELDLN